MRIRALIVDDESLVRNRIKRYLQSEPDVIVAGECVAGEEAVAALREGGIELVFLDIQMPGKNGLEVVENIGPGRMPVTIFVTAYDQFAMRAFEAHALDYLLKPFSQERFQKALNRARTYLEGKSRADLKTQITGLLGTLSAPSAPAHRLAVKCDDRVLFLRADEIDWLEAEGDYVRLHQGKEAHFLRASMSEFERKLASARFCRVHRSTLVNLDSIKEFRPLFNGESVVVLKDGTRLAVSRRACQKLRDLLAGGG